ncbi:MAG: peptide ABC transporter substrate-binding protein [Chloroflexota bacterium]
MQNTKKAARLILLLVLSVAVFALVGGVMAQDGGKVLVSGRQMSNSDIPTLDPSLMQDVPSVQVAWELSPGLARVDEETSAVQPGLATSWDVSDDGTVYTFHIMEGVPWVHYNADSGAVEQVMDESGNPRMLTAGDFAYGITRTLSAEVASPYVYVLQPWIVGAYDFFDNGDASVLGLNVIDDQTLEVTLPIGSSIAPVIFDLWVTFAQPQWVIDEFGEFWTDPENMVSFGPFALKEWERGDGGSLTMIKNPFWPGTDSIPQSMLDEVTFRFLDQEAQLVEFEAGSLDVGEVPNSAIDRIKADPTLSAGYFTGPGACTYYYGFNSEHAPFDDARVRRAFSMAIDRQAIVENVTRAGESPAGFFALPSLNAVPHQADYPGMGISSDPDAAQALFQEYLDETGQQASDITPTLLYNDSSLHASVAQAVQQMWSETLGVNVQLTVQDFATYLAERGNFDIYRAAWCYDYPDAHNEYYDVGFHSDLLPENDTHWSNADYDALVDQAFVESDTQARTDLYAQADNILVNTEAAIAPIYFYVTKDITQPYVTRTHSLIAREAYEKWDINR